MNEFLIEIGVFILGYIITIISSTKILETRIKSLEKKVDKHNTIIERTYILEGKVKEFEKMITK